MSDEEQFKSKKNSTKKSFDEIRSELPPEVLNVKQEITSDDLKEKFPNLHSEMITNNMKIKIDDVEESFSRSDETPSL